MNPIARAIDHTILRPDCTLQDIRQLCAEAVEFEFAAVCVPPYYVKEASRLVGSNPDIRVATVIGFPMGYSCIPAKVEEIKRAINDGADELDVVVNIAAVKSANWNYVKNDIDSVTRISHLKGKVIKIIFETTLLTTNEIKQLCEICSTIGVDFVKTSTGFQGAGATVETVSLLKQNIEPHIKIKASGGIRTCDAAQALLNAGAHRLGCSKSVAIVTD